jgi:hypothetical protein
LTHLPPAPSVPSMIPQMYGYTRPQNNTSGNTDHSTFHHYG